MSKAKKEKVVVDNATQEVQDAPLTEEELAKAKKAKNRRIINIVFTALQIAIVIVAVIFSIFLFISPNKSSQEVKDTSIKFLTVLSDSMSGSYSKGDPVVDPRAEDIKNYPEQCQDLGLTENDRLESIRQTEGKTCSVGSFTRNDLLVGKVVDYRELQVGDVVAYRGSLASGNYDKDDDVKGSEQYIITHRIISKNNPIENSDGSKTYVYVVIGDYEEEQNSLVSKLSIWTTNAQSIENRVEVKATYDANGKLVEKNTNIQCKIVSVLKGTGSFIKWMQQGPNFLLLILIPLGVLFIYNVYLFVRMVMDEKIRRLQVANAAAIEEAQAKATIDEEEIKRKAIEEYLRQHAGGASEEQKPEADDTTDEKKDNE